MAGYVVEVGFRELHALEEWYWWIRVLFAPCANAHLSRKSAAKMGHPDFGSGQSVWFPGLVMEDG